MYFMKPNNKTSVSYTVEYKTWEGIKKRCYNHKAASYYLYGGRGIKMCLGWRQKGGHLSFINDMGFRPDGGSIDRIDGELHYSCGHCAECIENNWLKNCRWADNETQSNNTKRNKYVYVNGEKLSIGQAEVRLGFKRGVLWARLKRGWPEDEAISKAATLHNKKVKRCHT